MSDTISILRHPMPVMAKTWQADGTISEYGDARYYRLQQRLVQDVHGLSALLRELETDPRSCLIRGAFVGKDLAKERDGSDYKPGKVRRALDYFDDQPLHALLVDVDKFEPLAVDPLQDPVGAIDEFVMTMLPDEFKGASFHWQLSNSFGHPTKSGELRAHLWFWLETPYTSAQLTAWAKAVDFKGDHAMLRTVQVHYTSTPIMAEGVIDTVAVRSGFVEGLFGDSVPLVIDEAITTSPVGAPVGRRQRLMDVASEDPIVVALSEQGLIRSQGRDGGLNIVCPFVGEHTTGEGAESSTMYYPPNTGGFAQGNFKCLHASCVGRTRGMFLSLLGVPFEADVAAPSEFPLVETAPGEPEDLPSFLRDKKGQIEPTITNTVLAVRRPDLTLTQVAYDNFRDEITVAPHGQDMAWRSMTDADAVAIRMRLEAVGFKSAPKELARDACVLVAAENEYDSAQLWLQSLQWDGKPRVARFLVDMMGCEDTPYTRAVALYMWSALAGRVLQPGVKADMVPIYEGDQGLRKSSAIEALSPAPEFFVEIDFDKKEDDTVRSLRGALVGEIAELSGLHTRQIEWIKKFVVRRIEKWVPKFKEFSTTFARRLLFIGTTNNQAILADVTGHRRWLPLHITKADVEGIVRDREQLWAEGAELFKANGVMWHEAEALAVHQHDQYTVEDVWEAAIAAWLDGADEFGEDGIKWREKRFTTHDVMAGALHLSPKDQDRMSQKRTCEILRAFGFVQKTARIDGIPTRSWVLVTRNAPCNAEGNASSVSDFA